MQTVPLVQRAAARLASFRVAARFPENHCSLTGPRGVAVVTTVATQEAAAADPVADANAKLAQAEAAFLLRQYSVARDAYIEAEGLAGNASRGDLMLAADLGWAGCELQLGNFSIAESIYEETATLPMYPPYTPVQAAFVFLQLGTVCRDWGDTLFRNEQFDDALAQYSKVLTPGGQAPASDLYTIVQLNVPAAAATKVIANLPAIIAGQATAASLDVNPMVAALVADVQQRQVKLANGLDYWGHPANTVPIWNFEYLQDLATNFAQLAIAAERDFINFQERSDQGSATRQQLVQLAAQAGAEVAAAGAQAAAAAAEAQAYATGAALAKQRSADAMSNVLEYAQTSALAVQFQAWQTALSGGDSSDIDTLQQNADILQAQGYLFGGAHHPVGMTAGAASLVAGRLTREYEVDSMMRMSKEMDIAATQAAQEATAAQARVAAANAGTAVATLHAEAAQQNLQSFDTQTFTPDVWQRMADTMWRLYRRYLEMAIKAALLMQKAYNFETDQALRFIKIDYSTDEVKGLLGADALMADIQTFTYDLITSTAGKPQPVKQTISLAQRYAWLFENQFRRTGAMEFETRVDDFDQVYPGTYAGRIEGVELEVIGLVPPDGLSGTLSNSGISGYRLPAGAAGGGATGLKYRIQSKETLVLSDYRAREDSARLPGDTRMRGIFQGAGLVSSWRLELPRAVNDLDYGAVIDVRLTFLYKARYDPGLHDAVLAELNTRPGLQARQRGVPLRWVYPDAFFRFQDGGPLTFSQRVADFAANETQPVLSALGLVITTDGTIAAAGLVVRLSTPGRPAVAGKADANGLIDSGAAASPWVALAGGSALGDYALSLTAEDNPALVVDGTLRLTAIVNLAFIMSYSYTPKGRA